MPHTFRFLAPCLGGARYVFLEISLPIEHAVMDYSYQENVILRAAPEESAFLLKRNSRSFPRLSPELTVKARSG
jgi:hypothetical protein